MYNKIVANLGRYLHVEVHRMRVREVVEKREIFLLLSTVIKINK